MDVDIFGGDETLAKDNQTMPFFPNFTGIRQFRPKGTEKV